MKSFLKTFLLLFTVFLYSQAALAQGKKTIQTTTLKTAIY